MEEVKEANPASCAKCRRRKAKCDRGLPCSNCVKTSAECTYETIFRTPLTRKHLTEVEEELARTKEQLKRLESASKSASPAGAGTSIAPGEPESRKRRATSAVQSEIRDEQNFYPTTMVNAPLYMQQEYTLPAIQNNATSNVTSVPNIYQQGPSQRQSRPSVNGPSPAFSMETPPAGDFDWDERARTNNRL